MTSAPFMTPGAGPVRAKVERRAAFVVLWLSQLPRLLPPVVVVVAFFAGVLIPGAVGCVILALIVAFMALLTFLAWPALPSTLRAMRVVVLVAMTVFALSKVF